MCNFKKRPLFPALLQSSILLFNVISKRVSRSLRSTPISSKIGNTIQFFFAYAWIVRFEGYQLLGPMFIHYSFQTRKFILPSSSLVLPPLYPKNMRATYSLAGKGEREKNLELIFLSTPAPSSPSFSLLARFLSRIPRENCEKNLNSAARVLITATLRRLCVILKSSGAKEVFRPDVYFLAPVIIRRQNFHGFSSQRFDFSQPSRSNRDSKSLLSYQKVCNVTNNVNENLESFHEQQSNSI